MHYNKNYDEMMNRLKITTVGSSAGVVLPKDVLARLRVGKGDTLYALETANGIELPPYDPEAAAHMAAAEEIMREDRDLLKKLAA